MADDLSEEWRTLYARVNSDEPPAPEWTATRGYADSLLEIYRVQHGDSGRHVQVWWIADRDSIEWRCFTCNDDTDCPHVQAAKRERARLAQG